VALLSSPFDSFSLRFERAEHVMRMVLDEVIIDVAALVAPLGARLDIDVRHALLSDVPLFCRGS